jgi:hypothetical protein
MSGNFSETSLNSVNLYSAHPYIFTLPYLKVFMQKITNWNAC